MPRTTRLLLGLAGALLASVAVAAETPVDGVWQTHEYRFVSMGFTSHYSCDGLATALKALLKASGARPGYSVTESCAEPAGRPDAIARATMHFQTLRSNAPPAAGASAAANPEAGQGVWREVALKGHQPRELDGGDCELVEQFAREVLPMFETKDVDNHMSCVPHEANPFGINLSFTVLAALPPPPKH